MLGLANLPSCHMADVWRGVGRELARLHRRVRECPDPNGYLDDPSREQDIEAGVKRLVDAGRLDVDKAQEVERLAATLRPHVTQRLETRVIHNDVHPMNVMCTAGGKLLAIIDWGDAGWGDPTLDFAAIPLDAIPFALAGYEAEAPEMLGGFPEARFVWYKLLDAMDDLWNTREQSLDLDALYRFMWSRTSSIQGAG